MKFKTISILIAVLAIILIIIFTPNGKVTGRIDSIICTYGENGANCSPNFAYQKAKFAIYPRNNPHKFDSYTTDENGYFAVNLPPGFYTLTDIFNAECLATDCPRLRTYNGDVDFIVLPFWTSEITAHIYSSGDH